MRRTALLLALVLLGASAAGADVRVAVTEKSRCLDRDAMVRAVQERAGAEKAVAEALLADGTGTLALAGDGEWRVTVVSPRCWSATTIVHSEDVSATIAVYPLTSMTGTFEMPRGTRIETVQAVVFRGDSPTRGASLPLVEGDPTTCVVENTAWRCSVPADVPFDVRLRSDGYAPVYYWGVTARPNAGVAMEPATLRPGSSITAWIQVPDGSPAAKARVVLDPVGETDRARKQIRQSVAMTNARGVVQFTGLNAGEYRLASELAPWSPAVVAVIPAREGEAVEYPRPVRHAPYASVHLTFTPANQESGEPWIVQVRDAISRTADGTRVKRTAAADGRLTIDRLPATIYALSVETSDGGVVEETTLDLSHGGDAALPLSLEAIRVHGELLVGDEPLRAFIRFSNGTGKSVGVATDDDGAFTAAFPSAGTWSTTILLGAERSVRLTGPRVDVPKEADAAAGLEIRLPGGRLRGTVVTSSGGKTEGAVHAMRDGRIAAQQITEDGAFDFVGLEAGRYTIDAQGKEGVSPEKSVEVSEAETTDITLTLENYEEVDVAVRTPNGAPASGASVELSTDGGIRWTDRVTDVDGRLRLRLPPGTGAVELLVNTAAYPSRLVHVPVTAATTSREIELVLSPAGGRLSVSGRAYIVAGDTRAPYIAFIRRGMQMGYGDSRAFLEPGHYQVCAGPQIDKTCRPASIAPGSTVTIDLSETNEGKR